MEQRGSYPLCAFRISVIVTAAFAALGTVVIMRHKVVAVLFCPILLWGSAAGRTERFPKHSEFFCKAPRPRDKMASKKSSERQNMASESEGQ